MRFHKKRNNIQQQLPVLLILFSQYPIRIASLLYYPFHNWFHPYTTNRINSNGTTSSKSLKKSKVNKSIRFYTCIVVVVVITTILAYQFWYDDDYFSTTTTDDNFDTTAGLTISYEYNDGVVVAANSNSSYMPQASSPKRAIISYEGIDGMQTLMYNYWHNQFLCEITSIRKQLKKPRLPITINVTFSSIELYENSGYGTGNYIELLYGLRLPAYIYEYVDVYVIDIDTQLAKKSLILPWLTGYIPSQHPYGFQLNLGNTKTDEICTIILCIANLYFDIQYDLRKMAIALVGIIPPSDLNTNNVDDVHPSVQFAKHTLGWQIPASTTMEVNGIRKKFINLRSSSTASHMKEPLLRMQPAILPPKYTDTPIYSENIDNNINHNTNNNTVLSYFDYDDVIIHFRCGDIMDSIHPGFAFMKFSGYIQHISKTLIPKIKSIGILTQPYDNIPDDTETTTSDTTTGTRDTISKLRPYDRNTIVKDRCRIVVPSFVDYIQKKFPTIKQVRIHNHINETIALSYARIIMAKYVVIIGISSFSSFPAVASFSSQSFIREPTTIQGPNYWLIDPKPINTIGANNVVLYSDLNTISVKDMKELWETKGENDVLKWFWS